MTYIPKNLQGWGTINNQWSQPISESGNSGNFAVNASRLYFQTAKCVVPTTPAGVDIKMKITTAAASGKIMKVALFTLSGITLTKLAEGQALADSIATITITVAGVYSIGQYWIGYVSDGTPSIPLVQSYGTGGGSVFGFDPTLANGTAGDAFKDITGTTISATYDTTTLTLDTAVNWGWTPMAIINH